MKKPTLGVGVTCCAQPVQYSCCVIKRHWCSHAFGVPLPTCTMWTSLDDVWYHQETAVYTYWCCFQQPTKRFSTKSNTFSCINMWHHILHRKSHQKVIMESLQRLPSITQKLGALLMQQGIHCSPRLVNQKQCRWQVMLSASIWCKYTIKQWFGEMLTVPHLSFLHLWTWDGNMVIQDYSTFWVWSQKVAWKWFCVHARSNAQDIIANAGNQSYDAHQCVHVSDRMMIILAWM